jgi:aerobic carbon-monoxide dehydrogenase medium subunit
MLVEVRVPVRPGAGSAYHKVERRAGDWAIAAAGAFVQLDGGGAVADVGIGLAAVGAEHFTCPAAEDILRGAAPDAATIAAAAAACRDGSRPQSDQRGPEDYKRHLIGELAQRALFTAVARAQGRDA